MVKISKKTQSVQQTHHITVVKESNVNWSKIYRLIKITLVSCGVTMLLTIAIAILPKKKPIILFDQKPKQIIEFKQYSNIYYFDPSNLINGYDEEDRGYLLVDTRSNEEFELGHIKNSVNVPLYTDYRQISKTKIKLSDFINQIRKINKKNRTIVLYGYYARAQILLDAVQFLGQNGISGQALSISWYEFKNNPASWMPGNDLGLFDVNQYIEGLMYKK